MHLLERVGGRSLVILTLAVAPLMASPLEQPEHVVVTESVTTILDVIEFDPGTATLRPSSLPTLDAVAETLIGNPSIERVEVQSHTADANQELSDQRAVVVAAYLVRAGVEPSRLAAQGYSNNEPIDPAAPTKNERIAFLILQRSSDP